nr:formylglycine-generating enzyme family protein [Bacteroidota bacterium]
MSKAAPAVINYKTKEPVRQFITAGTADEEVPDKSIFCSEFIEALKGNGDRDGDGYLTGSELGEYLQAQVVNYSNETQHPQYGKIRESRLDKGDFVFVLNSQPMESLQPTEITISEEKITRYGSIELTSEISGSLYIDGTFMKQVTKDTRVTLNPVTTGMHNLRIVGDETWQESVAVSENITSRVTAKSAKHDIKRYDWEPEMVFVKGGTFTMGCTSEQSDCGDEEKPVHQVTVSDFYIGKYEVTQKQWREVMGASAALSNPSYFKNCDDCPVEQVSWNDVQEFIKKLNQLTGKNYRLPTEAEWEYAARGGVSASSTTNAGSNNLAEVGWYGDNSGSKTHPVGQKKSNELGIYDMSGNVWEWCSDWNGSYSSSSQTNPKGPSTGSLRVIRGGSWYVSARYCRVALRYFSTPGFRGNYNGFRMVIAP